MTEKIKIECTYELLTEANLHLIPPLFKAAFKKHITLEQVIKKYNFSAMNQPYLGLFAFHEGRPVAFIGICYYIARYKGVEELASNFTDSMVHPDYQGKNIYVKLLDQLKEVAKENGICFSLGFPNDNSFYPVVHKGKWLIAVNMVGFMIQVKTLPLRRFCRRLGFEKNYLQWASKKLQPYVVPYHPDAFIQPAHHFHIVHDEVFFNYKQSPAHFLLKLADEYVWIKLGTQLAVEFIPEMEETKLLAVVNELSRLAKKLYIQQVMLQFTTGASQELILRKKYTFFESWPVLYSNQQSAFPPHELQIQYCDVDSF
jgi:GNAT superfamily N-acetyltransferase